MATRDTAEIHQLLRSAALGAGPVTTDRDLLRRFAVAGDQDAFAALVRRHAGMVLGVCRRALPTLQDAEDACQATFLVLARKAGAVRWQPSVANWLYTTARKVARNALVAARRRARREARAAAAAEPASALDTMTGRELLAALDEELGRLAAVHREPLVLCYLEGLTRDQAAGRLGVPVGTLKARLHAGRKRLAAALTRRGVALGAGLLTLGTTSPAEASPPALIRMILAAVGGTPSAAVAALARGVAVNGWVQTVKGFLAAAAVLGLAALALPANPPPDKPAVPAAGQNRPPAAQEGNAFAGISFTYAGRAVGLDCQPVAGAQVYLCGLKPGVIEFVPRATTGPDGAFRFTVRRDEFGDKGVVPPRRSPPEQYVYVAVSAPGYGTSSGWNAATPAERDHLVIPLPVEEIVRGRVLNPEGKPVAGVKVAAYVRGTQHDDQKKPLPFDAESKAGYWSGNVAPFEEGRHAAVSDQDGRFTLRGLGRGWLYDLYFQGPTVVNTEARLVARPQPPAVAAASGVAPPDRPRPQVPFYGSEFTHVVLPCKPIVGTVRERGTGTPIAGVEVVRVAERDDDPYATATTDQAGGYRLVGLPPGKYDLTVRPPAGAPYLDEEVRVDASAPGIAPLPLDVTLPRRPVVRGRVLDAATGQPPQGWVEYRPLAANPALADAPLLREPRWRHHAPSAAIGKDGRFTLAVLPGPGVLLVSAGGPYLPGRLTKEERAAGVTLAGDPEMIDCRPLPASPAKYQAHRLITAVDGKDLEVDLAVTPDRTWPLTLEFADGKPRDAVVLGLLPAVEDHGERFIPGKALALRGLTAGERRRVFASTWDYALAGAVTVEANPSGPVALKLQPTGAVTGRLVGTAGKPVVGLSFQVVYEDPGRPGVLLHGGFGVRALTAAERKREERASGYFEGDKLMSSTSAEKTDADGRFKLTGLVPGVPFDLRVQLLSDPGPKGERFIRGFAPVGKGTVEPGKTLDLGDLVLKPGAVKTGD